MTDPKFQKFFGNKEIFKDDEFIKRNFKQFFENKNTIYPTECLHPEKNNCKGKNINSHSIQSSKILRRLANKNNKVIMLKHSVDMFEGVSIVEKEVGIRNATTFQGLCNYHDANTFRLIETNNFDIHSNEMLFQYCYRPVLKNYYEKIQSHERIKDIMAQNKNEIQQNEFLSLFFIQLSYGFNIGHFYAEKFKFLFDKCLIEKTFDVEVEYNTNVLDFELPIAVSTAFTPKFDLLGNTINFYKQNEITKYIFLNIFPEDGKTYILLGHLKQQDKELNKYVSQIINSINFLDVISELILRYVENFTYSPDKWFAMKKEKRQEILKFFESTIHVEVGSNLEVKYESSKHNLFD